MKTKKIVCIILSFILTLTVFNSCKNKSPQDGENSTQNTTKETDTTEPIEPIDIIDIIEVKQYLKDNYNKVNIDGSTSMIPLHQALDDLFGSSERGVQHNKTVYAFDKFIAGENDILLGVDYSDEMLEKAENSGVRLVKKEITREAFVFLINKNNPVKSLSIEQIKDIYSGKITNWNEVGGDDAPINAFQRNSDSGSQMRMVKFMDDIKLTETDVEYYSSMGFIVETIGNYDEGKYSIGYNFYTFTEKQYPNDEVILLEVNGIYPDDETIFNQTYSVTVYNYIYYDENNTNASEYANNLYIYLMSEEGQKLISDSGYVNIDENSDRNKNVEMPFDYETTYGESNIGFYNDVTGEYYDIDPETNELLVFGNYIDYVLYGTKYKDNEKAREFLTSVVNSEIAIRSYTASVTDREGIIYLDPWNDSSFDPEDVFNYKYNDIYYAYLKYYIDEDKYILSAISQDLFDDCTEWGYFEKFSEYAENYIPDSVLELTKDDLKNLYFRAFDYDFYNVGEGEDVKLKFFQPFK